MPGVPPAWLKMPVPARERLPEEEMTMELPEPVVRMVPLLVKVVEPILKDKVLVEERVTLGLTVMEAVPETLKLTLELRLMVVVEEGTEKTRFWPAVGVKLITPPVVAIVKDEPAGPFIVRGEAAPALSILMVEEPEAVREEPPVKTKVGELIVKVELF